jgi:uncharacterized protein YraI
MSSKHIGRVLLILATASIMLGSSSLPTMMAQGGPVAHTISNLNVHSGPGETQPVVSVIPARVAVYMEGRNRIGNWVLIDGGPGGVQGWVASRYLVWPDDVDLGALPVVDGAGTASAGSGENTINVGAAVERANAWPVQIMHLRQGTDTAYPSLGRVPAYTGLVLEARSADNVWALVHTADGQTRGWVAAGFLQIGGDVIFDALPVSGEVVSASPAAAAPVGAASVPASDREADLIAQLSAVPILPAATPRSRQIFQSGQQRGNQPHVFAKVGDCNTESWAFMGLIGIGHYELGAYGNLQSTVEFFSTPLPDGSTPFTHNSLAGRSGHTSMTVIDPLFGDPNSCQPGESLLSCEYRLIRPGVAFIMFGESDMHSLNAAQYEQAMRQIIQLSIDQGVIPVLTTFPSDPLENSKWMDVLEFNAILVRLAREYDAPLLNFWLAARSLPHSGVEEDLLHVSYSGDEWIRFNGEENQWGYTLWNLIALQTLENLRRDVLAR